jgi:hypothetical protein
MTADGLPLSLWLDVCPMELGQDFELALMAWWWAVLLCALVALCYWYVWSLCRVCALSDRRMIADEAEAWLRKRTLRGQRGPASHTD